MQEMIQTDRDIERRVLTSVIKPHLQRRIILYGQRYASLLYVIERVI